MNRMVITGLVFAAAGVLGLGAAADEFTVSCAQASAPENVNEAIRGALSGEVVQAAAGGAAPRYEFWFVKELPLKKKPERPGQALNQIEPMTLVGAVRVNEDIHDFRNDVLKAGVYTMRFAFQPNDGDHLGTAPEPYFVVLTPAAKDTALDAFVSERDLFDASMSGAVARHPLSLSLRALAEEEGAFPRVIEIDSETKAVCLKLKAKAGGETFDIVFSTVIEGKGEV